MAAPKGNKFWEARSSHGRNPIFTDPEVLWNCCVEYFEWVEENPLKATKVVIVGGAPMTIEEPRLRAMTKQGLCLFLGIETSTWEEYRKREDFYRITKKVDEAIYEQKFLGASADLLNANIIARDLGLKDKTDIAHTSPDGSMSIKVIYGAD